VITAIERGQVTQVERCLHNYTVPVVKIDCSNRLAFLLLDLKLIRNKQQLISKTDTNAKTI